MPTQAFEAFLEAQLRGKSAVDSAHDITHVRRVVALAIRLCQLEDAEPKVVVPAAWLHDCVPVPKDATNRRDASKMAANAAIRFLRSIHYPGPYLDAVFHAIETHAFSRNLPPRTIEAKVVQDADRLDAIGAIGIARCFAVGGRLNRPFYSELDPFCQERTPDDARFTIDHFYQKLLTLCKTMQTRSGRKEALRRNAFMLAYLQRLSEEIAAALGSESPL